MKASEAMRTIWAGGLAALFAGCAAPDALESDLNYPVLTLDQMQPGTGAWREVESVSVESAEATVFDVEPGAGVIMNGAEGRTVNLLTDAMHGDAAVHIEFNVPKGSNSGVYFQGRYEIQILDSYGKRNPSFADCGGLYERWENGAGFEGRAPAFNASLKPGQWQSLDVVFRAPRFDERSAKIEDARFVSVRLNGVQIHTDAPVTGPTRSAAFGFEAPLGRLMLQGDHGPVAYRNLEIRPLSLD